MLMNTFEVTTSVHSAEAWLQRILMIKLIVVFGFRSLNVNMLALVRVHVAYSWALSDWFIQCLVYHLLHLKCSDGLSSFIALVLPCGFG